MMKKSVGRCLNRLYCKICFPNHFFLFFSLSLGISYLLLFSCAGRKKSTEESYRLKSPVHVFIDRCGVPHIFAESEDDAFYVFGYIQAHMRLFHMDISRREAVGRLAEIFPSALNQDRMARMLGFRKISEITKRSFEETGVLKKVKVFVQGVNRYISDAEKGRSFGGLRARIPPQYELLGVEPEPFSVEDVIAIGKVRAFELSGGGFIDIAMKLIQLIYGDRFEERFSLSPVEKVSIVDDFGKTRVSFLSEGESSNNADRDRIKAILLDVISKINFESIPEFIKAHIFTGKGSNNFVVSGKLTKDGYPILENDPHLSVQSPSTFFPFQIKTPEYDVKGLTFPGVPIALVGATPKICWGVTTSIVDVSDILIVPLKKRGDSYFVVVGGKEIKAEQVEEEIIYREVGQGENGDARIKSEKIRFLYVPNLGFVLDAGEYKEFTSIIPLLLGLGGLGGGEIGEKIREVIKGIITFGLDNVDNISEYGILLTWTGYKPTSEVGAFYEFTNAEDVFSAMQMIKFFQAGAQNFVLADIKGNIAYYPHAEYPIRKKDGVRPYLPNFSSELFWVGLVPPDILPRAINPTSGYIVTANNDLIGTTFDNNPMNERYYIGPAFDIGFRAKRITELIESSKGYLDKITASLIVNDVGSPLARRFLERYFSLVGEGDIADFPVPQTQRDIMLHIHSKLKDWDFVEDVNSSEALYFEMLFQMSLAKIMWDNFIKKYFIKRIEEIIRGVQISEETRELILPLLPAIVPQISGLIFGLIKDPNISFRTVYPVLSGEKGEICPAQKQAFLEDDLRYIYFGEDLCPKDEFLSSLSEVARYLWENSKLCGGDYTKCVLGDFSGKRFSYFKSFPGSTTFEPMYTLPDGRKSFYFRKSGGSLLVYAAGIDMISVKAPQSIDELMKITPQFKKPDNSDRNGGDIVPFPQSGGGQTIKFICEAKPTGTDVWYVIPGGVSDDPSSPYFATQITAWACAREWLLGVTDGYCSIPQEMLSSLSVGGTQKISSPSEQTFKLVFSKLEDDFGKLMSGEYHTSPVCRGPELYLIFKEE